MPACTLEALRKKLSAFPKRNLIHLPTPLARLENLSRELAGPEIWIKRDDLTGAGFGGNKSRKLEFIVADALAKKADTLITWGSTQSNWCMQAAAAARRFGIRPVLLLFETTDLPPEYDGNLLLDFLLGAEIRVKEAPKGKLLASGVAEKAIEEIAAEVRDRGGNPYTVAVGGSMPGLSMARPLGALSYVAAFAELEEQARAARFDYTHIVHATGSGATQAGLVAGARALGRPAEVIGISVSDPKDAFTDIVLRIAADTGRELGLDPGSRRDDVIVLDEYLKEGYGVVTTDVADAIRFVFASEGIVLDPVYTGKAMAGLVDLVKRGRFRESDRIVFLHTGGTPALFPYRESLIRLLTRGAERSPD
jgi:D-cysteine desulfhydrase family pyridoxal phosphate-dependent enzyme